MLLLPLLLGGAGAATAGAAATGAADAAAANKLTTIPAAGTIDHRRKHKKNWLKSNEPLKSN